MRIPSRSNPEVLEARITPAVILPPYLDPADMPAGAGISFASGDEIDRVTNIGDFNGDGYDEFVISSPTAASGAGKIYVIYGRPNGFPQNTDLTSMPAAVGFSITGRLAGDGFGTSVAGGDVNGDGKMDIIVGAPFEDNGGTNRGSVYAIFGRANVGGSTIALTSLDGATGFEYAANQNGEQLGFSVASGNDITGDGIDDIVAGSPFYDVTGADSAGRATVIAGRTSGFTGSMSGFYLNGSTGYSIEGVSANQRNGFTVNIVHDLNGDGIGELIIGRSTSDTTPLELNGVRDTSAVVVFGKASRTVITPISDYYIFPNGTTINDRSNFEVGPYFRSADVNGDGHLDLLGYGGYLAANRMGLGGAAILGGGSTLQPDPVSSKYSKIVAFIESGNFPAYMSIDGGDFNGDGKIDLLTNPTRGSSLLYFGKDLKGIRTVSFNRPDNFFAIENASTLVEGGVSAQFIGDINNDGFDDLAIQSRSPAGATERVHIVFGTDFVISRDAKKATWIDEDGDIVTLSISRGALTYDAFRFADREDGADGAKLERLDLERVLNGISSANVTVSVKKNPDGGDGSVKIGRIVSSTQDLGHVKIKGSLESMRAGDTNAATPAMKSFTVESFGREPGESMPIASAIHGGIGRFTVTGSMDVLALDFTGLSGGKVGSFTVGGDFSGDLNLEGSLGSFKARNVAANSSIQASFGLDTGTSIIAREIGDGVEIMMPGHLKLLHAAAIKDATVTVYSIAKLIVSGDKAASLSGDFGAALILQNGLGLTKSILGSAKITGVAKDATITASGSLGTLSFGAMEAVHIHAGFTETSPINILGGGTFSKTAAIKSITTSGTAKSLTSSGVAFADSTVIAAIIGKVSIESVDETNDGVKFGIGFRDSIGSASVKLPAFSYQKATGGTQGTGDFAVVPFPPVPI